MVKTSENPRFFAFCLLVLAYYWEFGLRTFRLCELGRDATIYSTHAYISHHKFKKTVQNGAKNGRNSKFKFFKKKFKFHSTSVGGTLEGFRCQKKAKRARSAPIEKHHFCVKRLRCFGTERYGARSDGGAKRLRVRSNGDAKRRAGAKHGGAKRPVRYEASVARSGPSGAKHRGREAPLQCNAPVARSATEREAPLRCEAPDPSTRGRREKRRPQAGAAPVASGLNLGDR